MSAATVAGVLLIGLPLAFNAAFAALAAKFDYPDILRRPTDEVLARFRAGGTGLVMLWWGFAMTAVLLAPLAVLLASALHGANATLLAVGATTGVLAAVVQFLGLIRWPFLSRTSHGSPPSPTPPQPDEKLSTSCSKPSTATSESPSGNTSATCSPAPGASLPASP